MDGWVPNPNAKPYVPRRKQNQTRFPGITTTISKQRCFSKCFQVRKENTNLKDFCYYLFLKQRFFSKFFQVNLSDV
jgi:hypothetical protein